MKRYAALLKRVTLYAALMLLSAVVLLPVLFMLTGSFTEKEELLRTYGTGEQVRLLLIPSWASLQAWVETLLLTPGYLLKFWSSIFLVSIITMGQTAITALGGYGFAVFDFPGRRLLLGLILILMLIPYQVTLVPNYLVLDRLGLIGSRFSVILPGIFSVFGVFLLRQAFAAVPADVLEAARMDGAGESRVFAEIALPNAKTGIAALAVLTFVDHWNMVEQPLIFLRDPTLFPLSVFLSRIDLSSLHIAFACGVLAMLPVTLLLLYMKDALIRGIEYAGLK